MLVTMPNSNQLTRGKVIAKKMLKYVPTVGVSWALNDYIFLERNWEKDKTILTEGMDVLASYRYYGFLGDQFY